MIPEPKEALYGFSTNELKNLFAGVSVSPQEDNENVDEILKGAGCEGFNSQPVTINDVIRAIYPFSAQAKEDEILHSVILKASTFIGHFIVKIMNASLEQEVFFST